MKKRGETERKRKRKKEGKEAKASAGASRKGNHQNQSNRWWRAWCFWRSLDWLSPYACDIRRAKRSSTVNTRFWPLVFCGGWHIVVDRCLIFASISNRGTHSIFCIILFGSWLLVEPRSVPVGLFSFSLSVCIRIWTRTLPRLPDDNSINISSS